MSKRIIVLSDGTGNSAAQVWRTNVWRTFEALDLLGSDQVAFYDDGVGTSSFKPTAILGGAFGFGLKRNVIDIYKFICRNYRFAEDYKQDYERANQAASKEEKQGSEPPVFKDDDIFGFGFSRGAFTIRVVVGLCLDQGIIRSGDEAELDARANEAYRNYRARRFHTRTGIENVFRLIRDRRKHEDKIVQGRLELKHIKFLGLWDTVAAYGLPVDEMTRGVSRYIWPLELPDHKLDDRVTYARHALSLDDQRTTFHPVLWNESDLKSPDRLVQAWFSGVHSNVGGGYPDDSLAYIPMYWIWKEARNQGLRFKDSPAADPDAFLNAHAKQDKDGRLYDSRSGLGGYYRYGPRDVYELSNFDTGDDRDTVKIKRPKIHESVFNRLKLGAYAYAPIGLPHTYDVLTYDPATGAHNVRASDGAIAEEATKALTRYKDQLSTVWTLVWRGRGIYFLTVLASLYLVIYPLALTILRSWEETSRLHFLSDIIRLIAIPLPHAADRWVDAYAADPGLFVITSLVIAILMGLGAGLRSRISDQMRSLLNTSLDLAHAPASSDNQTSAGPGQEMAPSHAQQSVGPAGKGEEIPTCVWRPQGFLEFLSLAALFIIGMLGLFGPKSPEQGMPTTILDSFFAEFHPFLGILAFITLITLFVPQAQVAGLRSAEWYKGFIKRLRFRWAPLAFAIIFCVLGVLFAAHYTTDVIDSFGGLCEATLPRDEGKAADDAAIQPICTGKPDDCAVDEKDVGGPSCKFDNKVNNCFGRSVVVDTRDTCTSTGIFLEQYHRYELIATIYRPDQAEWRFGGVASSLGGTTIGDLFEPKQNSCGAILNWDAYPLAGFARGACNYSVGAGRVLLGLLLSPIKRTFEPSMGTLMLRYGQTGNRENYIYADPGTKPDKLREQFVATRNGELFVYLNKPIFGFGSNWLRNYNSGKAKIKIVRVPPK